MPTWEPPLWVPRGGGIGHCLWFSSWGLHWVPVAFAWGFLFLHCELFQRFTNKLVFAACGFPTLRVTIDVPAKVFAISLQELHGLWVAFFKMVLLMLFFFSRKFTYISCLSNQPLSLLEYFQNAACFCLCASAPLSPWQQRKSFFDLELLENCCLNSSWGGSPIHRQSLRTQIHQSQFNLHYIWAIVCRTNAMIYQTGWLAQSIIYVYCCISFCMWKHFLAGPKHFPPEAECDEQHFDGGQRYWSSWGAWWCRILVVMVKKLLPLEIHWLNLQPEFKKGSLNNTNYCTCQEHKPAPATKTHTWNSQTNASAS